MKKSRFSSALFCVSLSFVLMPATAKAAMWDVPVAPGESFRWVFVTSAVTPATSPDISTYNGFVNAVASAAGTSVSGVVGVSSIADIDWKAIVSTSAIDAIDNVGPSSAGIYTPLETLVANGTADMFDSSLAAPISITETGTSVLNFVWTGTDWYGEAHRPLGGSEDPAVGYSAGKDHTWMYVSTGYPHDEYPMYAISEPLTVVPLPGALILAATGLLSSTLGLKRLRRKHEE